MNETTLLILEALKDLDHANNEHWTADGLPRVDVMKELTGLADLTRQQLTEAEPTFMRQAVLEPTMPMVGELKAPLVNGAEEQERLNGELAASGLLADPKLQSAPLIDEDEAALTDLQRELKVAEAELTAASLAVNEATRKRDLLRVKTDAVRERAAREEASVPVTSHIQRFLQAKVKSQQEAAALRDEPRDGRSAMDRAFARKTGFGHGRPGLVKKAD